VTRVRPGLGPRPRDNQRRTPDCLYHVSSHFRSRSLWKALIASVFRQGVSLGNPCLVPAQRPANQLYKPLAGMWAKEPIVASGEVPQELYAPRTLVGQGSASLRPTMLEMVAFKVSDHRAERLIDLRPMRPISSTYDRRACQTSPQWHVFYWPLQNRRVSGCSTYLSGPYKRVS
jgi:hypothetical protein